MNINWIEYYKNQAGGQYNYYNGPYYQDGYGLKQRGDGFGDMFKRFASWVVPIIKKHAIPTLESGAKHITKEALDSAADVAKDLLSGTNLKTAASNRYKIAIDNLKERAENALEGRGIKRKKSFKKQVIFRKKQKRDPDIFD